MEIKRIIKEESIFEMSNIRPEESGLPMVIWVSPKTGNEGYNARIKVERSYGNKAKKDMFTMTIDKTNPEIIAGDQGSISNKDVEKVKDFIRNNYTNLISLWNDNISPTQFTLKIKK